MMQTFVNPIVMCDSSLLIDWLSFLHIQCSIHMGLQDIRHPHHRDGHEKYEIYRFKKRTFQDIYFIQQIPYFSNT